MISLLDPYRIGPHVVVEITGELDLCTAPILREQFNALARPRIESLVVDLRGVTFLDSTGAGSLVGVYHRQTMLAARAHFVADQPSVTRVFDLMQLSQRLHLVPSVAAVDLCCADVTAGGTHVLDLTDDSEVLDTG